MKKIEIVAVYQSGIFRPNFALGAHWDQATHYFTDYLCADRDTYILPDGYAVAQDMSGEYHIYGESNWPCQLESVLVDGEWLPLIYDGNLHIRLKKAEKDEVEA